MFKKALTVLSLFSLTSFVTPPPPAQAGAPLVLGIVGTALGGTALALGLYNTIQHRRLRNNLENGYYYDSYYPVSYEECYDNYCYSNNAGYSYGYDSGYHNVDYGYSDDYTYYY